MTRYAQLCFRRRYRVLLVWVVGLVALALFSGMAGEEYSDTFSVPGTESTRAAELLADSAPALAGDLDRIVWRVGAGSVHDAAVQSRVSAMLAQVRQAPHVASVVSPYTPEGAGQVSPDGRIAYASVTFDGQAWDVPNDAFENVIAIAGQARADGVDVELGGNGVARVLHSPPGWATGAALIAAGLVLLIAFGSLLSATLPLVTAVLALGVSSFALPLLSHVMTVSTFAGAVGALIGLGVGIDYALVIVTRYRNGLMAGRSPQEASTLALNTTGRAVVVAGGTVFIALLSLLVVRVPVLTGLAVPAGITVLITVLASVTVLPAFFGIIGNRALSRRERRRLAGGELRRERAVSGGWLRLAEVVQRWPRLLALAGVLVLAVLSIPMFDMRLGTSDQSTDPETYTTRQAYDLLSEGFGPGYNGPLVLVGETSAAGSDAAMRALGDTVRTTPGIAAVGPVVDSADGRVTVIQVYPDSAPDDAATSDLRDRLRDEIIPATTADTGLRVHVGGVTSMYDDFAAVLSSRLPWLIVLIVALGGLLLLVAFRSLVIPLTAAVMNLLSAAAVFGVVTAMFQWGWGSQLFDAGTGPIDPTTPVMMVAILFGLSMDYQVFLVSRIHEEWLRTGDNHRAVAFGQAETGRVITAAAVIMILVFCSFGVGVRLVAQFGIGMAIAVLIDAFVLRTLVVPATMHLLGRTNWWLPRRLDRRLPRLSVQHPGGDADPPARRPARRARTGLVNRR